MQRRCDDAGDRAGAARGWRTAAVWLAAGFLWIGGASGALGADGARGKSVALFPADGPPTGWSARSWNDVSQAASPTTRWMVRDGVLLGSEPRGSWLVSDREYGDFVLEFEFRLPPRGNGGVGFWFPASGDPAVEGFELRLVDPRYYPTNAPAMAKETLGSLSRALPAGKQVYEADAWNRCRISARGTRVEVQINGQLVQNVNLAGPVPAPVRGKPLPDRPRRGRLGFLESSRGGGQIQIRGARITAAE